MELFEGSLELMFRKKVLLYRVNIYVLIFLIRKQ